MSESKHTPGPWIVEQRENWLFIGQEKEPNNKKVEKLVTSFSLSFLTLSLIDRRKANANLIAAAPDMLEALECVKDGRLGWEDAVDHAILKAKGKKA